MRVEPIRKISDIEKMEHVLKYYSFRDWFMFKFGINTALRIGDMLNLSVWQVRDTHLQLKESKTRKIKRFYINESLRPVIEDYTKFMDDDDYLFRTLKKNKPITIGAAYTALKRAAEYCGLRRIGTHSMRKTFGYHFYRETGDIAMLMELLNHSKERETLIYIGVIQEEVDLALKKFYL